MGDRVCIFVDGENFRHSVGDLFPNFHRREYLPRSADWTSLFDWLTIEAAPAGRRVRTYWYVIASVDFYPYRFPDVDARGDSLRNLLSRHPSYRERLDPLAGDGLRSEMAGMIGELEDERRRKERTASWRLSVQDAIARKHRAVEFRRAGSITYDLFRRSFRTEKAVDVKLATDLIMLRDIYDVALILSGDQDYVPAVEVVKDSGKRVINAAFRTRGGELLPGGARRLNQVADWSLEIDYHDLGRHLGLSGDRDQPAEAPRAEG